MGVREPSKFAKRVNDHVVTCLVPVPEETFLQMAALSCLNKHVLTTSQTHTGASEGCVNTSVRPSLCSMVLLARRSFTRSAWCSAALQQLALFSYSRALLRHTR
eukprot:3126311-Amphidinium_carterae.1